MTEDQMREIAMNMANAITVSDVEKYPAPPVFSKSIYVGAMQALKFGAIPKISSLEDELKIARHRIHELEEMLKV